MLVRRPLARFASSVAATSHHAADIAVDSPKTEQLSNVRSFKEIPGPRGLPYIGNVWRYLPIIGESNCVINSAQSQRRFAGDYKIDRLHESGHYNLQRYGHIVREHVYGDLTIVHLFDPKHIEQVFRTEGRYPERRSHRAVGKYRHDRPEIFNSGGIFCE